MKAAPGAKVKLARRAAEKQPMEDFQSFSLVPRKEAR
jgi:hypothetical protein